MSNLPTKPQAEIRNVLDLAEHKLEGVEHSPFSEKAFQRLKEKIGEYSSQLIVESIKRSKRHQAESVSTSDVESASQYLVSSSSHKIYRHLGTFGGLFLGTALSNVLSMITTNQFTLSGIIVTFVLTLIGTFMIAAHIVKE